MSNLQGLTNVGNINYFINMNKFSPAEESRESYYHVYNRGVEKRSIFIDDNDRWRFLTLLIALQGDVVCPHIDRIIHDVKHRRFDSSLFQKISAHRNIELTCFCLMSNHFHLILGEKREGGISKFMQRLSDAYTKYFNTRHRRVGHLFGGKFQSIYIDSDAYLKYLSAYIHLNPHELKQWRKKEINYPWSSFQDYVSENRWKPFLNPDILLNDFDSREYRNFVLDTPIREKLEDKYLIDSSY